MIDAHTCGSLLAVTGCFGSDERPSPMASASAPHDCFPEANQLPPGQELAMRWPTSCCHKP